MSICKLCPRACGIDRDIKAGFCASFEQASVSRVSLHMWEEPPISGERGSGTIFFSGCNLRCVFCQNKAISRGDKDAKIYDADSLASLMLSLEDMGAHNLNLVTPSHFVLPIAEALSKIKSRLTIPVVYNSSGYELVSTLKMLDGLVDVYLPDFKYASSELSQKYSCAPDYPEISAKALSEMYRQVGAVSFDEREMLLRGMIVRHLVLPSNRRDSIAVLDTLASILPIKDIRLSLMSQYTPEFATDCEYKELHRRVTSFEYNSVLDHALSLGFEGYFQHRSSATASYTPDFKK
ncbi:MAG: radical SAM protein [Clostridia bacterium]|nr:radical SAM protein [Clostridia bacterium]